MAPGENEFDTPGLERRPCDRKLWVVPMSWERSPPAESQQGTGTSVCKEMNSANSWNESRRVNNSADLSQTYRNCKKLLSDFWNVSRNYSFSSFTLPNLCILCYKLLCKYCFSCSTQVSTCHIFIISHFKYFLILSLTYIIYKYVYFLISKCLKIVSFSYF